MFLNDLAFYKLQCNFLIVDTSSSDVVDEDDEIDAAVGPTAVAAGTAKGTADGGLSEPALVERDADEDGVELNDLATPDELLKKKPFQHNF